MIDYDRNDLPCGPWAGIEDTCGKCKTELTQENNDGFVAAFEKQLQVAIATVYDLTRRIYSGPCTETIYPCKKTCACGRGSINQNNNLRTCDVFNDCECGSVEEIKLPYYPVSNIVEINIGGVVLDPNDYMIRDEMYLRRLDGKKWPTCQSLDPNDPQHWFITLVHGVRPPLDLVEHTLGYACQLAFRCYDKPCVLPSRYTVKQGYAYLDPMEFVVDGLTGYAPLDAVIRRLNPKLVKRPPRAIRTSLSH